MTITVGPGKTGFIGPFDAAGYVQPDGDLFIDFDDGFTGIVRACRAPRI